MDLNEIRKFGGGQPIVRAHSAPWRQAVEFLLYTYDRKFVATHIEMTATKPGELAQPSFSINYEDAQLLMDDLWNAGIRPTDGAGSAGAMAAVQKHLEDMRRLVFDPQQK